MARYVVVLASGETELRALPHLVSHLQGTKVAVRTPPNGDIVNHAERIIKSIWYEDSFHRPDKIVVLIDVDGKQTEDAVDSLRADLSVRLPAAINVRVLYAYAQWHLEAWYFADATNLRESLQRDLGRVDTSRPDEIENPKLHLKNLLRPRVYTASVSEEIAGTLKPQTIEGRSPSFKRFVETVKNGVDHGAERDER